MKFMSGKTFRERGYLGEVNRAFLHPLGLALTVDGETGRIQVWDSQDDPEGIVFTPEQMTRLAPLSRKVKREAADRLLARRKLTGFVVQPLPRESK